MAAPQHRRRRVQTRHVDIPALFVQYAPALGRYLIEKVTLDDISRLIHELLRQGTFDSLQGVLAAMDDLMRREGGKSFTAEQCRRWERRRDALLARIELQRALRKLPDRELRADVRRLCAEVNNALKDASKSECEDH